MPNKKFCTAAAFMLLALVTVFALAGCAPLEEEEVPAAGEETVVDYAGREVHLDGTPSTFVSTMPSNTEILFALGLGDGVVGVTDFCDYPPEVEERERVGDSMNINLEKIVELSPDLVLSGEGQEMLADSLEDVGIPVVIVDPKDLEGVKDSIHFIGEIAGRETAAREVVQEMEATEQGIREKTETLAGEERPMVLVLIDTETLYTVGEGTFLDELIAAAGGQNIGGQAGEGYFEISEEKVLEENPDYILSTFPMKEQILDREGWEVLDAIQEEKIYDVDGNLVSRPGPRMVQGIEIIYEILHE